VLAIALVWVAEIVNTAFKRRGAAGIPRLRQSRKGWAAGAVLVAAIAAVVIGALVLWPYVRS
jgi:diacylglycerol kinase